MKESKRLYPEYCYVDTAFGDVSHRNNVKKLDEVIPPDPPQECYISMFRFREEYKIHCDNTGSVKDTASLPCCCDYLWFDIDDEDIEKARLSVNLLITEIERRLGIEPDHLAIFFSGCKGFHIGIPSTAFGVEPLVDLPQIFKRLALEIAGDIKIDKAIYDKNRLWRMPNSINKKSGLYKIPLKFEELVQLDSETIKQLAGGKRELPDAGLILTTPLQALSTQLYNKAKAEIVKQNNAPEPVNNSSRPNLGEQGWVAKALEGLEDGNRNTTFTRIAGRLHQNNWNTEDITTLLKPHANACSFPLDELEQLIRGICERYPNNDPISNFPTIYSEKLETGSEPPKIITLSEFMAVKDTEISWCVENIFPSEGVGIIASPAGYGKSWMLIDLAVECARGGKWLGQYGTTQGVVLYIDEESSQQLLRRRFKQVLDGKGNCEDQSDIHFAVGHGICLNDNSSSARLRHHVETIKPNLIVIDSLIRAHRADENSAKEMSRIFAVVKAIVRDNNCLVVFADHQRKLGNFNKSGDQQLRGSTEKVAFVDTLLSIQKISGQLIVEHSKSRFAEPISNFAISIEDLSPGTTTVAYQGQADEIKKQERLKNANEFINQAIPDGEWISRKELVNKAKELKIGQKILTEALKTLESTGQIQRENRNPEGKGGKSAFFRRLISEDAPINESVGLF